MKIADKRVSFNRLDRGALHILAAVIFSLSLAGIASVLEAGVPLTELIKPLLLSVAFYGGLLVFLVVGVAAVIFMLNAYCRVVRRCA